MTPRPKRYVPPECESCRAKRTPEQEGQRFTSVRNTQRFPALKFVRRYLECGLCERVWRVEDPWDPEIDSET